MRIRVESHRRKPLGIRLGGMGERCELTQRGPGQRYFGHGCVSIRLQVGKSGQIWETNPKTGQIGVQGEL